MPRWKPRQRQEQGPIHGCFAAASFLSRRHASLQIRERQSTIAKPVIERLRRTAPGRRSSMKRIANPSHSRSVLKHIELALANSQHNALSPLVQCQESHDLLANLEVGLSRDRHPPVAKDSPRLNDRETSNNRLPLSYFRHVQLNPGDDAPLFVLQTDLAADCFSNDGVGLFGQLRDGKRKHLRRHGENNTPQQNRGDQRRATGATENQ